MHSLKRRRSAVFGMPSLALLVGLAVAVLNVANPLEPIYANAAPQATASPSSGATSSAGIAYDEIARIVKADATAPPVGAFAADAATIAALPPLVLPKAAGSLNFKSISALALIPYVGAWVYRAAANAQIHAQQAETQKEKDEFEQGLAIRRRTGVLASFAFYRGWSRVALSPQYTTIDKPDQGQTITLDNSEKTYQIAVSSPASETYTVQSGAQTVAQPAILKDPVVSELPPTRISGLEARGYRTTGTITIPQGTFLCASGSHQVSETEYVSDFPDPQYTAGTDSSTTEALVTACTFGSSVSHREPGRLVLYRVITVDEGTPATFTIALERGNVRTLDENKNDLFVPPADFKETK